MTAIMGVMGLCISSAQGTEKEFSVRPGAWEVRSGAPGQPMVGYLVCFKTGGTEDINLLLPRAAGDPACSAASTRREGNTLIWQLSCPQGPLTASARYAVQTETIEGEVSITSGTPPKNRQETISARYAGACATR